MKKLFDKKGFTDLGLVEYGKLRAEGISKEKAIEILIRKVNRKSYKEVKMDKKITKKQATRMLEVLPPTTWFKTKEGQIFQVGEAYDAIAGRSRFQTYEEIGKQWYYRGLEHKILRKDNIMENETYRFA